MSRLGFAPLIVVGLCACGALEAQNRSSAAEKPFVSGGKIEMQLEGGDYSVRPAADQRIRVAFTGDAGNARVDLTTNGSQAKVAVKDTPRRNFRATIEVPKVADLVVHLTAGNLAIDSIAGHKDVDSTAGNIEIAVGDPNVYSSVDVSVKAGDIDASAFGGSKSGLFQRFTWSGPGKHTLRVKLGAGNLTLRK